MKKVKFPLTGPLKEPFLIMECILFFLFLELALIFWIRVISKKNKLKNLQEKAYIFLFLGYSLMLLFFIIADFYIEIPELRLLFLNFGYIIQMIGAILFIYIIENYKIFIKRYLFTKIFTIDIIIYFFVLFFATDYTHIMSFTFWPIFIVFLTLFLKELYSIFNLSIIQGSFKIKYLNFLSGMIFLITGFGLTTDFSINTLGLGIRLLGDILQLLASVLLFSFFISIPSFSEYDWQDKIDSLLIMHKSGLFIYKKSFQEKNEKINESIMSGVITILKMMLEKVTDTDDISIIEKKGKTVIIQPGKYIFGVLICQEKLNSLQVLLSTFIERIEKIYSNVLESWNGDLKVFRFVDDITKEVFFNDSL